MNAFIAPLTCLLMLGGSIFTTIAILVGLKKGNDLPKPPVTWEQLYKNSPHDDLYQRLTDERWDPCLGEDD